MKPLKAKLQSDKRKQRERLASINQFCKEEIQKLDEFLVKFDKVSREIEETKKKYFNTS